MFTLTDSTIPLPKFIHYFNHMAHVPIMVPKIIRKNFSFEKRLNNLLD